MAPKAPREHHFGIVHYAGVVHYSPELLPIKNKDTNNHGASGGRLRASAPRRGLDLTKFRLVFAEVLSLLASSSLQILQQKATALLETVPGAGVF